MEPRIETHTASEPSAPTRRASRRITRRTVAVATALALAATLTACSTDETDAPAPGGSASPVAIPETPVGMQSQWVLDEINGDDETTTAEIEERFDAAILDQLSATDLQSVFADLRAAAPWTPIGYEGSDVQARVTIEASDVAYDMSVSVTPDGLMDGLLFGESVADRTPAASWDELGEQIEDAPFAASLAVSTVGDADPSVDRRFGSADPMPIGSMFKLWVLGAVVDAVEAGTLSWDDELTIDARVRSLPSGELQDLPDGSTVSVREAAEKMIAISDNTATDALILAVGRDRVEAAMTDMGATAAERNIPFPTTRELFWLLFGEEDLRTLWAGADGDPTARASVLERIPAGVPDLSAAGAVTPAWRDGVEWFATPDDIAAAHVALQERARTDAGAPVREILSANPGSQFDDVWTYVGFKGGSSPGVLAGSWYLERESAEPVVVSVFAQADDAQTLANPGIAYGWVEDAAALLGAP
ncbi:serine hydrolase [Microbacterium radiodurans]|uniref:Serine hydrolase n=1 Tax=Microbacterium radiodurans TaxID=661398 RepID=A0A5J5IRE2_9MICO|nr:Cpe/LpqF family protein [Microbacterium radiodurans]KAA9085230.1 serine hydrolase [Microbacterium radiodurans]